MSHASTPKLSEKLHKKIIKRNNDSFSIENKNEKQETKCENDHSAASIINNNNLTRVTTESSNFFSESHQWMPLESLDQEPPSISRTTRARSNSFSVNTSNYRRVRRNSSDVAHFSNFFDRTSKSLIEKFESHHRRRSNSGKQRRKSKKNIPDSGSLENDKRDKMQIRTKTKVRRRRKTSEHNKDTLQDRSLRSILLRKSFRKSFSKESEIHINIDNLPLSNGFNSHRSSQVVEAGSFCESIYYQDKSSFKNKLMERQKSVDISLKDVKETVENENDYENLDFENTSKSEKSEKSGLTSISSSPSKLGSVHDAKDDIPLKNPIYQPFYRKLSITNENSKSTKRKSITKYPSLLGMVTPPIRAPRSIKNSSIAASSLGYQETISVTPLMKNAKNGPDRNNDNKSYATRSKSFASLNPMSTNYTSTSELSPVGQNVKVKVNAKITKQLSEMFTMCRCRAKN